MSIKMAVTGGGDFAPMEDGVQNGVCTMIADLGMQDTAYGEKHKVYLRFEVPGQTYERDGETFNMSIGKKFTASLNARANLRKALVSWSGQDKTDEDWEEFDLESVLGKPATIVVTHYEAEGKTRAAIESITRYKGKDPLTATVPLQVFGANSSATELQNAPEWIKEAVYALQGTDDSGLEQQNQDAAAQASSDEDIPF